MTIQENISLKQYNTFGIDANAKYFVEIKSIEELILLSKHPIFSSNDRLILGGGSNILLCKDFDGIVIKIATKGIDFLTNNNTKALIKVAAGEIWHEFVTFCVDQNIGGGIENLSLIPGCIGASPMQNIGAYGVEIKDIFKELKAFHIPSGEIHTFNKEECKFGYRESVFKRDLKGQYIIIEVVFQIDKTKAYNTSYGAIQDTLNERGVKNTTVKEISLAVTAIRQSKLPDPKQLGNAGSFFKNPEIPFSEYEELLIKSPQIPNYPTVEGFTKVPAGWLIEQCGWKGKVIGNTGVHKNQALVLVNYGNAKGEEIKKLAFDIIESVQNKFGITLENEVNFI
jgi:UDP-N-acetylmuramate dehydrogenase